MIPDYAGLFKALAPEAALVAGALLVLGWDLAFGRGDDANARMRWSVGLAALAIAGAMAFSAWVGEQGSIFGGVLMLDSLAVASRLGVLSLALLSLGISTGAPALRNPAEFVVLVLFATVGLMLMAAAQQLLLVFLALELASLSLYVLVGFDKSRPESAEASLKYFLFGGMSAAFLLFGFSLLYGLTGSIELAGIAASPALQTFSPLLAVALVMILVAFGFKAAAAPFHLWAPDAYQGAPTTSAALIASASKLSGFVLFARLLWPGLRAAAGDPATFNGKPGWVTVVALLCAGSLLLGNIGALAQTNLRRLLAYSAIAHSGALLLGVIGIGGTGGTLAGAAPLLYYATTYGLATVGAFGVIAALERSGGCQNLSDLAGLHRRSPLLAGCLMVFILSLAGIPPLAGFFGKFAVFSSALQINGISGPVGWLTLLAIFLSAVALYYYLLILKQALVAGPQVDSQRIALSAPSALALLTAAGLIILFGLFPSLLLGSI